MSEQATQTATAARPPDNIVNPDTGELVDRTNADELIDQFEYAKLLCEKYNHFKYQLQLAIAAHASTGEKKTRRVCGKRRAAKVEFPGRKFDQSILKELWNSYPDQSKGYIRIESLGVQIREFDKLLGTTSTDPAFQNFQKMLIGAEREPTSTPYVTIEK